jgi:CBS domain-containing protein
LRVPLLGAGPIFPVHPHSSPLGSKVFLVAAAVGLVAGFASGLLTRLVYGCEDLFLKVPIHWMWWPAIGGLFVGLGGLVDPRVLGVGYDTIHALVSGRLIGAAVIGLLVGKALVWSIALGSGTSGGVLAPLLIMGGALGAILAPVLPAGDASLWAMVSMAAMMGGTMRAPLTSIVFTLELTRDINTLPALLIGAVAAHGVTVLIMKRSILTEKVARRGHHLIREYSVDPFEIHRIDEVMDREVLTIPAAMTVADLSQRIAAGDPGLNRRQGIPIVDASGGLAGIITRSDLMKAMDAPDRTVLDAGSRRLVVGFPDELLRDAVRRMLENDIGRLPIVDRDNPRKLVGYLGRSGVMAARVRMFEEETVRERGGGVR